MTINQRAIAIASLEMRECRQGVQEVSIGAARRAGMRGRGGRAEYHRGVTRSLRWTRTALVVSTLLSAAGCAVFERAGQSWWDLSREPSGQAPDPSVTREAVLQVYGARAVSWRGIFAVHTWIALKPSGADTYTRYEVMGWGVDRGTPAVRVNRTGPDNYWFGARPDLLLDRRGAGVDQLIARVEAAVKSYPYPTSYRTWPGPNSNTFIAHVARAVPELRLPRRSAGGLGGRARGQPSGAHVRGGPEPPRAEAARGGSDRLPVTCDRADTGPNRLTSPRALG
jgi:hypothetical protein